MRSRILPREWAATLWLVSLLFLVPSSLWAAAVEAWVQRYSKVIDSDDQANKVVTDGNGDVIVAGYKTGGSPNVVNRDMLVIKYSSTGLPLWTNTFNGSDSNDVVTAMTVDGSNNVILTGYDGNGSGGSYEYATIKYSSAGVPLWTNRYGGTGGSGSDQAQAVAVDSSGNVFVTGSSYSFASFSLDYATIAYSSNGAFLWINQYNGTGNGDDQGQALAVDTDGNVFVTGYSRGSGSDDYLTIKYSNGGIPLWTNRYNGPGNSVDRASAIVLNANGDVFISGYSMGSSSSSDYATIKYSNAGVPLWTNRYNGPANSWDQANDLAVDGSGNVYVTGYSYNGTYYDHATIKYNGSGAAVWTNRYGGPLNFNSGGAVSALSVDSSNNVYVAGRSFGSGTSDDYATVKYSGAGLPLWTNRYNGSANTNDGARSIAVGGNGNVYVTGYSYMNAYSSDIATIAYSGSGLPLWTNRYSGLATADNVAQAVALDADGNAYVTGYSYSWVGGNYYHKEYVTIKYSTVGVPIWTNRYYNGSGDGDDAAVAIALDRDGNVYVTGYSYGGVARVDYATISYSSLGVPLWTNRYNGPGSGFYNDDYPQAIAVDGTSGNLYVTGSSELPSGDALYATIAYSSSGLALWTNFSPGRSISGGGVAVAVGGNGNVYVTGASYGGNWPLEDYATIAYSSSGVPLWTNRYDGGLGLDVAQAVAVGVNGNVYVTGYSTGDGGWYDYATLAYSSSGMPLWTNRYRNLSLADDVAEAIALDGSGNVYVTGYSWGGDNPYYDDDYATIAYSNLGVPLWTNRYGPGVYLGSTASAVAVDGRGGVYVTGYVSENGSPQDIATIEYSTSGTPLWTNRYNGTANGFDRPSYKNSIAVSADGAVYVTGFSEGDRTAYDIVTIKYVVLPEVTVQLLSRTNVIGSTVAFSITATGTGSLVYQWQRNGTNLFDAGNISGAITTTLTLTNVALSDAANYTVVVTSPYGSATSTVATLTVVQLASLVSAFLNGGQLVARYSGTPEIAYTVEFTGNLSPGVMWQKLVNLVAPSTDTGLGIGVFEFRQVTTNAMERFYRVVYPAY